MIGVTVGRRLGSCFLEFVPSPGVACVRVANSPRLASCSHQMTVVLESVLLQMNAPSRWQHLWVFLRQHPSRVKAVFLSFPGGEIKSLTVFNFGAEERC